MTDLIEKKMIEVVFVPTKENLSDGFTKNVNRDTYRAHTPNYVQAREYWNEEYEEAKVDGLKIHPTHISEEMEWKLLLYSDSDWAGDKDDRKSISGHILYVNGVPVTWFIK